MFEKFTGSADNLHPKTPDALLNVWEKNFRAEFALDDGVQFASLIERFGLEVDAHAMLEGTIDLVIASAALLRLEGRSFDEFLVNQRYDIQAPNPTYFLTFDLFGRGAARLLVEPDFAFVDLADLYEYPWTRLEIVGYSGLWVSRVDSQLLRQSEEADLEKIVTDDIRYDYGVDEVSFCVDPDTYFGALAITVYDTPDDVVNI